MSYDPQNIFAKILRKEIPTEFMYENDHVVAFSDISPQRKVHILILPKGAYTDIYDFSKNASPEEQGAIYKAIADIAEQYNLTDNGFRVIANTKAHGGQEVPHLHFHLLGGEKVGAMVSK
ncbi:MAG: HIT domain-containing protein [Alphaproteobacteria bacterium]